MLVGVPNNKVGNYREYLQVCFQARKKSNPSYSLRAFARDIDCKVSTLSLIFNNKREISTAAAAKVAQALDLTTSETRYFLDLVHFSRAKNTGEKKIYEIRVQAQEQTLSRKMIPIEVFQVISDWYHTAILELTFVDGFKSDPVWISKRLDITPGEATQAIERLKRLGLLDEVDGVLVKKDKDLSTLCEIPLQANRNAHKQLLNKALLALETQSVDQRDFGAILFSGDPNKLAKAKKIIQQARREVEKVMEGGTVKEVYSLNTQLFRLSK